MATDYDSSRDGTKGGAASGMVKGVDLDAAREYSRRDNNAWAPLFRVSEDDQLFLTGHQWSVKDATDREDAGLVTLTINDLGQFLDQVVGDMRQHPSAIKIVPSDVGASKAKFISLSGKTYEAAEVRAGLIRQIETKSHASQHYNIAGQHAAETGFGWLRVYSEYEHDDSFVQDLCVERIKNRWSVLMDSMCTKPDYSDANSCFIGGWMPLAEYNKKHPGTAPTVIGADTSWWQRDGYVRVSEWYYRKPVTVGLIQLENGQLIKETDTAAWEAAKVSGKIINQRKVKTFEVYWCKITYDTVLEGPIKLPGTRIPVVPVLGKVIEGPDDDFIYGLFRFAKDPKRMENYWLSSATQRIAMMPNAPWTGTAAMFEGYENEWAEANRGAKSYLPWNVDEDAPTLRPERTQAAQIPAGEMQLLLAFGDKVKAAVGFHDASIGKVRNQQSGIAIERLQEESDNGAFVFTDNLRIAIGGIGDILTTWIGTYYDTERFITIRHPNGEVDTIEVNKVLEDGTLVNDITEGRFDTHAETGPAYSTLRQEGATVGMELMKGLAAVGDGQAAVAIADITVENMDFPGHDRIAKRLRKMVPPALIDETEMTEEERNAPPKPPSPQEIAANAMLQAQMEKAKAEGDKANAMHDTADATRARAKADIAEASADMVATLAGPADPAQAEQDGKDKVASEKAAAKPAAKEIDGDTKTLIQELVSSMLADAIVSMQAPPEKQAAPALAEPAAAPPPAGAPPGA